MYFCFPWLLDHHHLLSSLDYSGFDDLSVTINVVCVFDPNESIQEDITLKSVANQAEFEIGTKYYTNSIENLRNDINDTLGKRPQPQIKKTGWLSGSNDTDSGLNDRWESSY